MATGWSLLSPSRFRLNFIHVHYTWILFCSLLAFPVLYSYGNLDAVDAFFFGCSGSTESGLNTVDVKDLKTYQQVFLYVIPMITNLMFINAMVVPVRLYWFRQRIRRAATQAGSARTRMDDLPNEKTGGSTRRTNASDIVVHRPPATPKPKRATTITFDDPAAQPSSPARDKRQEPEPAAAAAAAPTDDDDEDQDEQTDLRAKTVSQDSSAWQPPSNLTRVASGDPDAIEPVELTISRSPSRNRSSYAEGSVLHAAKSIEKVATSAFVLGDTRIPRPRSRGRSRSLARQQTLDLPILSRQVTVGRNSNFYNVSEMDRERLGGIEYRALKLLLKFVFSYFFGLHLLGVVCLLPWIHNAPAKYTDWLDESGVGWSWWAIYSAQTMADNLGFTLTPDSMATFRDATWPMLIMTFMAFAGNTCYPVFLRLLIWATSKVIPKNSQTRETIQFLLDHPRRCYTLLFPSRPTWVLFGIVFALNFIDVVLIICLDLDNPTVIDLPIGPRILSALFQAASARHTGTSTLNLAAINPAVQFSLLTMMYIAVFPIAISIRASNMYEERTVGIWSTEEAYLDERDGASYVMVHIRNQLTFDLWYIFFGAFLICIAESRRIMDLTEPSFSAFPILFEVTSAYGNVGLSLGGPSGNTSMSGHFTPFSKMVICAMMIRGRHRGLPYALDRAINLPIDDVVMNASQDREAFLPSPTGD